MTAYTIDSPRFGVLEIPSEDVIEFPTGLIGLGGSRYALVANDADSAFCWLHSIDDPSLALPVANPWHFFSDYAVDLSDEEPVVRVAAQGYELDELNPRERESNATYDQHGALGPVDITRG